MGKNLSVISTIFKGRLFFSAASIALSGEKKGVVKLTGKTSTPDNIISLTARMLSSPPEKMDMAFMLQAQLCDLFYQLFLFLCKVLRDFYADTDIGITTVNTVHAWDTITLEPEFSKILCACRRLEP
jgi:hypothetical protein